LRLKTACGLYAPVLFAATGVVLMSCYGHNPMLWFALAGSFFLTLAAIREADARRYLLAIALFMPATLAVISGCNRAIAYLRPHTLDAALMRLDHGVSMRLYQWTLLHVAFNLPMSLVYCGLPLFAGIVLGASAERRTLLRAMVLAALCAPAFYLAFPAAGPAHLGDPLAPRNCVPSLHMTWALLLARFSRQRMRWAAIVFAGLTAVATLAKGEHYVIDLFAAAPYTAAMVAMAKARGRTRESEPAMAMELKAS